VTQLPQTKKPPPQTKKANKQDLQHASRFQLSQEPPTKRAEKPLCNNPPIPSSFLPSFRRDKQHTCVSKRRGRLHGAKNWWWRAEELVVGYIPYPNRLPGPGWLFTSVRRRRYKTNAPRLFLDFFFSFQTPREDDASLLCKKVEVNGAVLLFLLIVDASGWKGGG